MIKSILAFACLIILVLPSQAAADDFDADEKARIKALALEAILERPEIIEEAIARLQSLEEERRQAAIEQALTTRRDDLENDPNAPVLGNPDGDVTVVEFFDYNCPYCKRAVEPIKELLATDDQVRLVYREWPILGEGSVFAARAALAAREQGKYEEMHWALMTGGRADAQSTIAAAERLGLDIEKLREDMNAPEIIQHITVSMELAEQLSITGTPSFVVGTNVAPGLIPLTELEDLIRDARSAAND
ncbi:MAG: DsbA family protein [Hyphomonas sp.]|nr:DsbA family protein [Hyphomonas sp.]